VLLAIDIGNTNISCALFKGARIKKNWDIPVKNYSRASLLKHIKGKKLCAALICSVVPQITGKLSVDIAGINGIKPYIIGKDIKIPIKNLYLNQKQLGADRLVNAYAASMIYGHPVIVASVGTAITLDVVSKNGAYLGGLIQPGLKLAISILASKTALLPGIKLKDPSGIIGRDTRSCILSGVILGAAGSIDSLVEKIRLKTGRNTPVIGTGGDITLIKKFSKHITKVDRELTLKGINLIYEK
jgi:type III pantothenate kinase